MSTPEQKAIERTSTAVRNKRTKNCRGSSLKTLHDLVP